MPLSTIQCASKSARYIDPIFGHVVGAAECAWAFDRLPRNARRCDRTNVACECERCDGVRVSA